LADRYRAANVYVFPTVDSDEAIGVPMSIFEALANGTPVVARRSAALERWVDQPGLHLTDNDEQLIHTTVAIGSRVERIAPRAAVSSCVCLGDLSPCRPRRSC
jgi:glycosyltransferase involved in cell wall biosynthesis